MLSTGVIGAPLPVELVCAGLDTVELSEDGGLDAAEAILTTDTKTKTSVAHGSGFTVGGMAKGSGMIHPNLATMLAVVTTDYPARRSARLPAAGRRHELQLDLRRRRVLDERRGRAAVVELRQTIAAATTKRSPPP